MSDYAVIAAVTLAIICAGCTVNQKYVEVTVDKDACLVVFGDIDPRFMREGTTEDISQSTDADGTVPLQIPLGP